MPNALVIQEVTRVLRDDSFALSMRADVLAEVISAERFKYPNARVS